MAGQKAQRRVVTSEEDARSDPRSLIEQLIQLLAEREIEADEACRLTARLEKSVERRFAMEAETGRLEEVLIQAPWLTAPAQELTQQHVELKRMLRLICERVRRGNPSPDWRRRLQSELTDFLEQFVEHEVGEENLIQEAYRRSSWAID